MQQTISQAEYQELLKKQPKYGNQRVVFKGIDFDSKAEATRYGELLLLQSAGQIEDLRVQPSYELQPAFVDERGKRHRAICYIADFQYIEVRGPQAHQRHIVAEDVKGGRGTQSAVFLLKAKLFAFRWHGVELRIIER